MKKTLLATSAIALVGAFATSANAAEWEINFGGYMEQHLGAAFHDTPPGTDFDGFDIKSDQEFYVNPTLTLDNGIRFRVNLDFEGAASGGVDEPALLISGSFGSVNIGEDDLASYDVMYVAPDVTFLNINSGSTTAFDPEGLINIQTDNGTMTRTTYPAVDSDPVGITYFSPRIAGIQVGASYARDPNSTANQAQIDVDAPGQLHNIFAVGGNYVNSFGGFDVALSAGYSQGSIGGAGLDSTEAYAFGANFGFGGFTVGGSWGEGNDVDGTGASDGRTFDVGVSYETGPWGVSFTYLHSEQRNGLAEEEFDEFMLGAAYALADGLDLNAWALYRDFDDDISGSNGDIDGFVIGTGIKATF